ncbi:MAG TPA: hypothetical protein VI933_01275 [archaeon]|nr:hypothetical protein [archaeon]
MRERAQQLLKEAYDRLEAEFPTHQKIVVSGLTDVGVPSIAYREAAARNWRTVGIACSKASGYPCFPVSERIIVGSEWGEESETFLNYIDSLIRIGGGNQALMETAKARKMGKYVIEFNLLALE